MPDDAPAAGVLACLAERRPVDAPVAVVAAHPDDETIGAGVALARFRRLLIVHVTDGAPRNLADARAAGFVAAADYAATRRGEFRAALRAGGIAARCAELGAADQAASFAMPALAAALGDLLARFGARAVITHPYEGGHPDHDATAWIVAAARAELPRPPALLEMTSYHADPGGGMRVGCFLANGTAPVAITLTPAEQARKRAMLACFVTQQPVLAAFGTTQESFRPAPTYDFTRPPHPGPLHYERHDWGMSGVAWRELAAAGRR